MSFPPKGTFPSISSTNLKSNRTVVKAAKNFKQKAKDTKASGGGKKLRSQSITNGDSVNLSRLNSAAGGKRRKTLGALTSPSPTGVSDMTASPITQQKQVKTLPPLETIKSLAKIDTDALPSPIMTQEKGKEEEEYKKSVGNCKSPVSPESTRRLLRKLSSFTVHATNANEEAGEEEEKRLAEEHTAMMSMSISVSKSRELIKHISSLTLPDSRVGSKDNADSNSPCITPKSNANSRSRSKRFSGNSESKSRELLCKLSSFARLSKSASEEREKAKATQEDSQTTNFCDEGHEEEKKKEDHLEKSECKVERSSKITSLKNMRQKTFVGNPTKSFAEEVEQEIGPKATSPKHTLKSCVVRHFFHRDNKEKITNAEQSEYDREQAAIRQIILEQEAEEEAEAVKRIVANNKQSRNLSKWRKVSMFASAVVELKKKPEKPETPAAVMSAEERIRKRRADKRAARRLERITAPDYDPEFDDGSDEDDDGTDSEEEMIYAEFDKEALAGF